MRCRTSRSNTWQTILGVAGAASGMIGGTKGARIGTAINTGGSLGVASMLSKYSRIAERDADLNGARMVAAVGYDSIELARFFDKIEAIAGGSEPKGIDAWFATDPCGGVG